MQSDGTRYADHLLAAKRAGRHTPELDIKPLPHSLTRVWHLFWEIDKGRTVGFGKSPLSWCDLKAYCDLMSVKLCQADIDFIKLIDIQVLKNG